MAKKATSKAAGGANKGNKAASKPKSRSVARVASTGGRSKSDNGFNAGDAFIKLLQSPLVAELVAVAATAALASLAEHGFTSGGDASRGKRAGRAVKAAGKAAAAAVGRRLSNEMEEIKQAAKTAKGAAKA
jgi:hypothetical protein